MKPLVTDELWALVAPLLPRRRAYPKGGRPWVDDRATLNGILYVLRGGVPWRLLRTELGYGSGVTCGGGSASGSAGACGGGCIRSCSSAWLSPTGSTGRGRPTTRGAWQQKGGRRGRPEPDRQGQARVEAPCRPAGPAAVPPGEAARRQGLRLPPLPRRVPAARYQASDRAQRNRVEDALGLPAFLSLACALICWNYLQR